MYDYFDYSQLNCWLDHDVIATTPSFEHKTEANVFDVDGKHLCTGYWANVINSRHPKTA